jgi:2,4-dienoyl-CoA reductase (NADPH2)
VGKAVHEHDCKFILQLSHGGRQRDINGIEYPKGLSSTAKKDPLHGFECDAMTIAQIKEVVGYFAEGARRARDAGLDGVELHGANGYLITQFLSSAINDRKDEYGGSLENRARFVLDIVKAVRAKVGNDFHFQMKISAQEYADALTPFHIGSSGNTLEDSIQVCKWLVEAGIDAIHVSSGAFFPHPRNPAGSDLPVEDLVNSYDSMISSGERTFANFLLFRGASGLLARQQWNREAGPASEIEGKNLPDARAIKAAVSVPVICTGGFQTASVIEKAIKAGDCDGVSMARTLVANNDLPKVFASGKDQAAKPCTYCNRCLVNVVENPLGCYDVSRFDNDRDAMVAQIMSVFDPPPFVEHPVGV